MITLRCSKNWLSIVLILAILGHFGLGHRDASAFVLCFGVDGHVAVEHVGYDHDIGLDKMPILAMQPVFILPTTMHLATLHAPTSPWTAMITSHCH